MNQTIIDIPNAARNIDVLIHNNPDYYHSVKQLYDAKWRKIQIGVDVCFEKHDKQYFLFNEITVLSLDINTNFNRTFLMMLETCAFETKNLIESLFDAFEMDIEFDKTGFTESEIQFNEDIKAIMVLAKNRIVDEEETLNVLTFFQNDETVPDKLKSLFIENDFAKIKKRIEYFGFNIFEKRELLNRLKKQYEILISSDRYTIGDMMNELPKIQWEGTQKELGELFVELQKKNWINEIPIETIKNSFTKSASIEQTLKPTYNSKKFINEFSGIYSQKYAPFFDAIKRNTKAK